ncbi:MAG TPA: hypothetical protein VNV87_00465 [Acidimicrobiales bacterium]|jgi:hypothetical protein|nr:hypothetical protein [Acidimicrobiales bacterium]
MALLAIGFIGISGASAGAAQHANTSHANTSDVLTDPTGGGVFMGAGPDVKVTTSLNDFNCVDSQGFGGFTTKTWAEKHDFVATYFTSAHGCAARASWVRWNVSMTGTGWKDTGTIWMGQDAAGLPYYSRCENFSAIHCDKIDATTLEITVNPCRTNVVVVVSPGDTCSVPQGSTVFVNGAKKARNYQIVNVGPTSTVVSQSFTIKSGDSVQKVAPDHFFVGDGFLVVIGP